MSCMFSKILIKQCKEYWIRINWIFLALEGLEIYCQIMKEIK
jgi:hypothetical protein